MRHFLPAPPPAGRVKVAAPGGSRGARGPPAVAQNPLFGGKPTAWHWQIVKVARWASHVGSQWAKFGSPLCAPSSMIYYIFEHQTFCNCASTKIASRRRGGLPTPLPGPRRGPRPTDSDGPAAAHRDRPSALRRILCARDVGQESRTKNFWNPNILRQEHHTLWLRLSRSFTRALAFCILKLFFWPCQKRTAHSKTALNSYAQLIFHWISRI